MKEMLTPDLSLTSGLVEDATQLRILSFRGCIDLHVELSKCTGRVLQGGQKDIGALCTPKRTGAASAVEVGALPAPAAWALPASRAGRTGSNMLLLLICLMSWQVVIVHNLLLLVGNVTIIGVGFKCLVTLLQPREFKSQSWPSSFNPGHVFFFLIKNKPLFPQKRWSETGPQSSGFGSLNALVFLVMYLCSSRQSNRASAVQVGTHNGEEEDTTVLNELCFHMLVRARSCRNGILPGCVWASYCSTTSAPLWVWCMHIVCCTQHGYSLLRHSVCCRNMPYITRAYSQLAREIVIVVCTHV